MTTQPPHGTTPADSQPPFLVGIGAAAGGIEALTQFFEQVTPDSNMAYVVILHLSPDQSGQLTQLLQTVTRLPVALVTESIPIRPNQVYVVPANNQVQTSDGLLLVQENSRANEQRAPIDMFFRTLAESHGNRSIAVILSGAGANGSMGLKRVKERGGAVFVQNPREAAFNDMPRHAIATDLVDDILPVAQIPPRLLSFRQHLGSVFLAEDPPQRADEQQQALRQVFTQLRKQTGHDFSNYKRSTLLRRLERRISIHNLTSLPAYTQFLLDHPDETQALLKDLLISVTNFFRDQSAFTYLDQHVLPLLTQPDSGRETLRIWVAGCATGEEAYSMAMLCAEHTQDGLGAPKIQIFATDIDEDAISVAREGLYTINDAADVSPERLSRFFTPEGTQYRVSREIREMILFAQHNVLKDPPFSQLDLVSCRNLLIYLNTIAQERVMETFHFALRPGGYLLLGMSETVDGSIDMFTPISREQHLYQSRQVLTRHYPIPDSITQLPQPRKRPSGSTIPDLDGRPMPRLSYGDLHQQLLEQYAPPSIIINEDYDLLHVSEQAGRYLQISSGEPSKNLLKLIRPELRLELRTALYQAVQQQTNIEVPQLPLRLDEKTETLTLHVRPVMRERDPARGFILVLFEPTSLTIAEPTPVLSQIDSMARHLEQELIRSKAQLRAANEQHELQAEELKASNEELQAMNEELRSTAEELETGKEELQSINEELTTVNQELKVKVEEVSLASNNLQNLINSTNIATLFLDRGFRLKLFTPATRQIFNLIASDLGRPLTDVTNRLDYPALLRDTEAVLESLQPIEREVMTTDGHVFIMRVLPYRTAEDRINGVVLTFVDITERKRAEEERRESTEKYRILFNSIDEGFCLIELLIDDTGRFYDHRILQANPAFCHLTGQDSPARNLIPGVSQDWQTLYTQVITTGQIHRFEHHSSALERTFDIHIAPLAGAATPSVALVLTDITERVRAADNLRRDREHQAFLVQLSDTLRPLTDPVTIQAAAVQVLGTQLATDQTIYAEVDPLHDAFVTTSHYPQGGVGNIPGRFPISHYKQAGREFQTEQTYQITDVGTEPNLSAVERTAYQQQGISALLSLPLVKGGKLVARLTVHQATPRHWQADDLVFVRETAERMWNAVEQARVEDALRESERRLLLLGQTEDLANIGSWEYHRLTGQLNWSDGMYLLFGLDAGQSVRPDSYRQAALDQDQEEAQHLVTYLLEGMGSLETNLRIQVGKQIKTLRIKAEINGEQGQLRVMGVVMDITDQLLAQQQIRETAQNLQAVLDASPASVGLLKAVHDEQDPAHILDFRLAVGNDKLAQFFGRPLTELLGQPTQCFSELLWADDTLDLLRTLYETHEIRYEEKRLSIADQDRWIAVSVIRQDDGVVLTGLDITDLKQFQQQQQYWLSEVAASRHSTDALTALRASLAQRTELLRAISHDLRGNLGIINGALQLLGIADTESERAHLMGMVLRNVKQATELLTDLLDLARLENGQQSRTLTSFDASSLLQELGQSLRPLADEQHLKLTLSGPPVLLVDNDRQLVYRLVQNLLINALKYTHQGSVSVRWGDAGSHWWFEVADTGPGLADHIIAQFNTVDPVQPETEPPVGESKETDQLPTNESSADNPWHVLRGEGIGLRIVRELAQLLEASLQVVAEADAGTQFHVTLPIRYE